MFEVEVTRPVCHATTEDRRDRREPVLDAFVTQLVFQGAALRAELLGQLCKLLGVWEVQQAL